MISKSDIDIVKSVLPFWPRLYANLSTDIEHRVRETVQLAQLAIVAKAGKFIAPFLKNLVPSWIGSQFDNYATAGSIATNSFNKAFPANKVNDVFVFCEIEILEYFTKNLTVHTMQTICNPK